MSLKLDGIKIEEVELLNNSDKTNIYIAKVEYKILNNLCQLGNVSINREVDIERAKKMVEYIVSKGSFYPTIVAASSKKNLIEYNELNKTIEVKIKEEKDRLIVLDGQHRFESINLINENELKSNRYQSVLIIENINDYQQRKLFMDINNTPKKVTTGTKLRFDKTIANYYTLIFINKNESILEFLLLDENQTASNKEIPYKYLIKFNEKICNILNNNFQKMIITLNDIDKYIDTVIEINTLLLELIIYSQEKDLQITRYEMFYLALGEYLSGFTTESFSNLEDVKMNDIKDSYNKIKKNLKKITDIFLSDIPKTQSSKKEKIIELIIEIMGEN